MKERRLQRHICCVALPVRDGRDRARPVRAARSVAGRTGRQAYKCGAPPQAAPLIP
jgi:hypothetical protein